MGKWIVGVLLVAMPCMAWSAEQAASRNQELRFNQMFRNLDANNTGKISRAEAGLKAPALAENFDQIDVDHDGGLTKKEIKDAFLAADTRRREFSRSLEAADNDKNGKLSRDEAKVLPNMSANFDAIDSNHDEQLVMKEIADYVRAKDNADSAAVAGSAGSAGSQ
ncbi:MAG: EF-hand domain-containing protein [Gallionella sp.]|nr:EF-hand domain-containing protein [Gallionella sp.]